MKCCTALAVLILPMLSACDESTGPDEERFTATLSGANEVPAFNTAATGTAEFVVHDDGRISYTIDVQNLSAATAAHIHGPASRTANAGVLVSLFPTSAGTTPTGTVNGRLAEGTFTAAQINGISRDSLLALMRNGNSYVNVHSTTRPAGEIRGQIEVRR